MLMFTLKRLLQTIPTLFLVAVLVFTIIRLIPGDPAVVMVGDINDPMILDEIRRQMGLDEPLVTQFGLWLSRVFQGDLGTSLMNGEDVLGAMLGRFAVTAQIVVLSLLLAVAIALPTGLLAAARHGTLTDTGIVFMLVLSLSIPSFWAGIMLILVFGVKLGWLPTIGYVPVGENLVAGLQYLILPVFALLLGEMATVTRMMRSTAIEVLGLDYVTHARAKGLKESTVLWRHVFPNAFAPTLTVLGLILASLLGGAAVIETVFTLPGLGRFLVDGIYARDYPVVQGTLLLVAFIYVITNLVVDLLYPFFDPRVRL